MLKSAVLKAAAAAVTESARIAVEGKLAGSEVRRIYAIVVDSVWHRAEQRAVSIVVQRHRQPGGEARDAGIDQPVVKRFCRP